MKTKETWNHRVIAHKDPDGDYFLQIHEVYYTDVPKGYTENGISVGSDTIFGIRWVLKEMEKCLEKPILSAENFPNEFKLEKIDK